MHWLIRWRMFFTLDLDPKLCCSIYYYVVGPLRNAPTFFKMRDRNSLLRGESGGSRQIFYNHMLKTRVCFLKNKKMIIIVF